MIGSLVSTHVLLDISNELKQEEIKFNTPPVHGQGFLRFDIFENGDTV